MRKRLAVSMIFFLFLFLLISPTYAVSLPFFDDFERVGIGIDWVDVSGAWAIESGELSQSTVDASYKRGKIKINDLNVVDLVIEAKIKFIELYPAPTSNYAGFAVRYSDENNFYWIVLHQFSNASGLPNGNLELQFRAQFNYLVRVDLGFVGELGKFYKLKVDVKGNDFKIYVDDVLKTETSDTTFQNAGDVLLWTGRCHAHFDNVSVSEDGNPGNPGHSAPEFGVELTAITSIAAMVYMLARQRSAKKKK